MTCHFVRVYMRACGRAWDKVVSDASGYLKYIYISSSPSPPFYVIYFKRVVMHYLYSLSISRLKHSMYQL